MAEEPKIQVCAISLLRRNLNRAEMIKKNSRMIQAEGGNGYYTRTERRRPL